MVFLFLIFLVIQILVFFKVKRLPLFLFLLNLALMIAMFVHHITEKIGIRL